MRLKKLEIKGFKSFANATVLNFNENVVGVVGPNGSGKSNIVDAIRWVLGEQKGKELRLDNKSDVIFNGASTKKPAGVAQVSITFSNTKNLLPTEYNEVKLSRYLYRNGDSEYHLNGVKCRLKDIHNLLIDTGIGSNSYAIIALGMVEDILKDKDHARRKMFEQVSGISKYKKRKKETLNKLNSTTEDLDRVEDLLFEIEGNMKTLEKQAKRTEKYFLFKEEYKEKSIEYSFLSMKDLREKHQNYEEQIAKDLDDYRALEIKISQEEANLENAKKNQLEEEQSLSEKQKEVNLLVSDIRDNEAKKELLKQELQFKEESVKNSQTTVERNKPLLDNLTKELGDKEGGITTLREQIERLEIEFKDVSTNQEKVKLAYQESKDLFDSATAEKQKLEEQFFEKQKDNAVLNNRKTVYLKDIEQLDTELSNFNAQFSGFEKELNELVSKESSTKTEVDEIIQKKESQKEQLDKLQGSKMIAEEGLAKLTRTLDAKSNEQSLLKSMIDSLEGYPESIRYLAKNWDKKVPVLSDLLDVKKEFRGIIEHFLEPYLNYFVVENVAEAAKAIEILGKSQKGKAHFFLLDKIAKLDRRTSSAVGKPAANVITVDAKYQKIVDYLLGNVYLYDGHFTDDLIADNSDIIYLSTNGTYVKRKLSVSGGSVGLFEGKKIGRKKTLENLTKEISKLQKDKEAAEKDLQEIGDKITELRKESYEEQKQLKERELNQLSQQLVAIRTKRNSLKESLESIEGKKNRITAEIENVESQILLNTQEISSIESSKANFANTKSDPDQLDLLAQQLSEQSRVFNEKNIQLIQKKSELENLQNDIRFNRNRIAELESRLKESTDGIDGNKEAIHKLKEEIKALEETLNKLYASRDASKSSLGEFEQAYYSKRNAIGDTEDAIRAQNRKLQQTQIHINQQKDKFNEVKFQMGSVGERLKIEFEVELSDVLKMEFEEEQNLSELKERVEKLKKKIHNYGDINPMAVDAYNTMKERHDLISGQRNDILEAKESLMATIAEIEDSAKELFLTTFYKVRENFIRVFRSLFGENDSCDLILLDEENPLESGIDIIARPKGKRPLSLSQLSGGEMTLTATALLFAFYLQKPAPFCIFDEVDAPLDDANVLKFNNIIQEFSKDSQFVIVTHNKTTMAEVDVLYGVYMQDMGVSGVSPVDFRNMKHDPILSNIN